MDLDLSKYLVFPADSLKKVMMKIDRYGEGMAIVANSEKILLGIVTDGDIRRALIAGSSLETQIFDVMNKNPSFVDEKFSSKDIYNAAHGIRVDGTYGEIISHVPVLKGNGAVCGVILARDVEKIVHQSSSLFGEKVNSAGNKRVLITGGAGYIGSVLCSELLDAGYFVKVIDNLSFGDESIMHLNSYSNFSFVHADVGHIETFVNSIKDIDVVVHLAEIVGDPACEIHPEKTQQVNYITTSLIANICKYFQINRFIYASSCSVYGASELETVFTEKSHLNPISLYARMKTESEKAILNMCDGFFSPTILRFATVFGESPRMRFDLVVNTLTAKAVREGKITLFGGDQWRPFVHVRDIASTIMRVICAPIQEVKGQIFNVGSNENNFTINHVGELIKEIIPTANLVIEDKNIDKRNYKVDFSKIQTVLGFKPKIGVSDGIKEIGTSLINGKFENLDNSVYYNHKHYGKSSILEEP